MSGFPNCPSGCPPSWWNPLRAGRWRAENSAGPHQMTSTHLRGTQNRPRSRPRQQDKSNQSKTYSWIERWAEFQTDSCSAGTIPAIHCECLADGQLHEAGPCGKMSAPSSSQAANSLVDLYTTW